MLLQDNIYFFLDRFCLIFVLIRCHVTFKLRVLERVLYGVIIIIKYYYYVVCLHPRYMRWISSELCTMTLDLLKTCFRTLPTEWRSLCWVMPALSGWSVTVWISVNCLLSCLCGVTTAAGGLAVVAVNRVSM